MIFCNIGCSKKKTTINFGKRALRRLQFLPNFGNTYLLFKNNNKIKEKCSKKCMCGVSITNRIESNANQMNEQNLINLKWAMIKVMCLFFLLFRSIITIDKIIKLSPILYAIYIANFKCICIRNCQSEYYADDTALYSATETTNKSIKYVQCALQSIDKFMNKWKMKINAAKTQFII